MPKNKSHSGTRKRFRVTGGGKILRQQANRRHNFESKSTTRTRRIDGLAPTSHADVKRIRRLLGR
jgi:large subunit ribosomal protein L35